MMFNEILTEFATRHPAKAAVLTNERTITFGELDLAVHGLARHLADRGLRSGDRVGLHWHNSVEFVVVMLGAWRAGLNVVPINPRLKKGEIDYVLGHSGARLCFSEPGLAELVSGAEVVSELPLLTAGGDPLPAADPDAAAMILYTSGTTGRPKGVVHTQRSLFEGARTTAGIAVGIGGRPLAITQVSHMGALGLVLLPGLILGASVVLLRAFEAGAALDCIERFGCTNLFGLPACLQLMAEEQARHPLSVSSMRGITAGGDSVSAALQHRVVAQFHVETQEGHGLTEVLPTAFSQRGSVRVGSIGQAANCELRVVDAQGNDLEPGESGELLVRSPASCIGYWNDPAATAHLFEGGWLHTGDLFTTDEDGYFWFKGRLKQIIIRGGSNISPQEVEEVLYRHPAVLEAGVVGLPDATFGEIPVAFVALRQWKKVEPKELIAHVRTQLSDYKTPERIYLMEELPKGLTGKVDRRRLREILLAGAGLVEQDTEVRV